MASARRIGEESGMYVPLFALLLGAFSIGTTELVIAGLLPAVSEGLGVSIPTAGHLVTGYALGVAFGGPLMMVGAARFRRKPALIGVLTIFLVAHLLCAVAPSFALLMAGRIVAAAAHGCFFGLAIVLATGSVPKERRATALSIVVGGISVANIVGVPLGTAVGNALGWRAPFLMIAGFTAAALVAIALLVPDSRSAGPDRPLGAQIRALANRTVASAYGLIVLQMIATFSLITFIAPYLAVTAGIGPDRLPLVLMVFGAAGAVGVFAGGRLTDRFPAAALLVGCALVALSFAVAWRAMPVAPAVGVAALAVGSLVGSVATLASQNRVLVGALHAPELASTLMSSVFNVGIAAGAALGAASLEAGLDVADVPAIGLAATGAATALAALALLGDRRRHAP